MGGIMNKKLEPPLDSEKVRHLEKLYYDPLSTIAYSNAYYIYNYLKNENKFKYTLREIKHWLRSQDVHTTHSEKRLNKKYARVYANTNKYMYDVDTGFYNVGASKLSKFVIFVDVFSRYTHAEPVKNLKADTILEAFNKALKKWVTP